ncbi:AbrB/MazE/SpoVT family DNA-binding domain-containing protein [Bacillus sp. B1-WWTP-T-0.5-Post-4]|uniref:AbrB/MazE/SpoVT family DNA-binding domain-containing protein n=1 Tax=Bacillus sp. B1-WWTP-T-0.5-Post-4 TaxID=2653219 RepID=UPI0012619CDF|nr:AbrB/MazE/SpoVT family DNA-binding domain-containing protein [Bacillus sp. B1-WWTP-T-0.5-Post-4]KAB7675711.1 AbrB/MazE/SpoVT family DNA-binding domain-containing protein [Bacillus sp. B1-WWTP-T-0.5-Post-4]
MKSRGITRKADSMGRIVIPMEIRRSLGIVEKDSLEMFIEEDQIILRKYQSPRSCALTGDISDSNISLANGKIIVSPNGRELLIKKLQQYLLK